MSTQNNDSPVVAVNLADDVAQKRSHHIFRVASSRTTFMAALGLFAAIALAPADARAANTCIMLTTLPPATTSWSDNTRWLTCGGGYPGQTAAGDTAIIINLLGTTTINVDVTPNPVALQISGSTPVQIPSGSTLTLENSSSASSSNTFTVASGGTMGTASGANITGFQGNVVINGGTFNSLGTIQFLGGNFAFNGGSLTGSGTISNGSAQFTGSTGAMSISGTTFNDTSSLTYSGSANPLTLSGGATINVPSGSVFNLQNDLPIGGTSSETIHVFSGGTLQKTAGTGSNIISCSVQNDGGVDVSSAGTGGSIGFAGTGTHSGSFATGSSSQTIVFSGNNTFNTGTSFGGSTPITIAGGTQTFSSPVPITVGSGLKWSGGTIGGTGTLNVLTSLVFDGSVSPMTLTGIISSTAFITYAPANINNLLTINGASAMLETTTPGSLSIAGDYDILASPAGAGKLRISGTANVNKTAGATGSTIQAYVDNVSSAIANSASGPLNLAGGGQSTGSVSVPTAANAINFTGGTFVSTGVFSGSGAINVAGGVLDVNTATTFAAPLTVSISSGTLGGTGAITLPGTTTWSGGTITGSNTFTASSLTLTGANGPMALDGRTITNSGTLLYNSSTNNLTLENGAAIQNNSTFTAAGAGTIDTDGTATSITNSSLFNKTLPGLFIVRPTFNNGGSGVSITGGFLDIDADGTSTAPWAMTAGTEVWFPTPFATTYTWSPGTIFNGGKVTVDGSGTVATSAAMTINNTILGINGGTFSTPAALTITTPGSLIWNGGTMSGIGQTIISSGSSFDIAGGNSTALVLSSHTISNSGTITYHPLAGGQSNQLTMQGTGSIANQSGGTVNMTDNSSILQSGGATTISNSGSILTAGSSSIAPTITNNASGLIKANAGMLSLLNGSSTGTLDAVSPAAINFGSGATFTITGGTWGGSGGGFWVTGGDVTFSGAFSLSGLTLNSGQIDGSATLTLTGSNAWGGGTMAGAGTTINSGTLTMSNNLNSFLDTRTFTNNGTVDYQSGGSSLQLKNGSIFGNTSLFDIQGDSSISCVCAVPPLFHNTGTLQKSLGTGVSIITAPVNNDGSVAVNSGTLQFFTTGTHNGSFNPASGAFLFFLGNNTFNAPSTLTGAGTTTFTTGTSTINSGTVTPATLTISSANVTLNSAATIGVLNVQNTAVLSGTGPITINGAGSDWSGGTISGSGTLTINSGSGFQLDGLTNTMTLDTRPIVIHGILNYNALANGLTMANGAVITNAATLDLDATPGIAVTGLGNVISNTGNMARNVAGAIGIAPPVTNSGTINATAGQLAFNGGLSQSAGQVNLQGGSILSPSPISMAGGGLTGTGTVFASVNNSGGFLAPGTNTVAGKITLNGTYTQGAGGSMYIKLGGSAPGTDYDVVDASSVAINLAGTLNVTLFNAFTPASGNTFDVLKFSTRSGDFATYNLPTFAGGGTFQSAYITGTPSSLRLTSVLPQADLSISQSAPPSIVHFQNGTWSLTVTNGPNPATNVTVTDTFANATFVSASGGTCTPSGSTVTCALGPLAGNQTAVVTVVLSASTLSTISNSASVTATEPDPNTANNSVGPAFTAVIASTNLAITNAASVNPVTAGSPLSFTLQVSNSGPDATSGTITVSNTVPSGVTSATGSGAGWACGALTGSVITCTSSTTITSTGTATPLTIAMTAPGNGPAVDSASVSALSSDPVATNNSATASVTVISSADLTITKSGPLTATPGSNLVYTITVTNHGPSDASAVSLTDPTPANTTFVSNAGACTSAFPCALGTMTVGQTKTITSTFTSSPTFTGGSISNTATVTSATSDPVANNSATATTSFGGADLGVTKTGPATALTGATVTYTLTVSNNGPATAVNVSLSDPTPAGLTFNGNSGACSTGFPCALGNLTAGQSATILSSYTLTATSGSVTNTAQVSSSTPDNAPANDSASMTTVVGTLTCGAPAPTLTAPSNGATVGSPVTFSWSAVPGATSYNVFASFGGASTQQIGSPSSTSLTLPVPSGTVTWSVQALGVPNCGQLNSANSSFNVCNTQEAPVVAVVGTNTSGQSYTVQFTTVTGVTSYELQEASTAAFDNPQSFTVAGTSKAFTKSVTVATAFFYRVRTLGGCSQTAGPFSASERVVIVPVPTISTDNSATVDVNNKHVVVQNVFIPGQGPATPYTATTDEPWLTVSPASGILLPEGITLQVSADPADLPNGTFTATVIVSLGSAGKVGTLDTHPTVSVPVSVSVVTPVSPSALSTPSANSLIIPSVGHLDGINSQWRSDVRITNTAAQKINYLLRFTPAGGDASQIKQTQISIASGDTTALDDIVKNWYGVGVLGDAANGVLEVRPLNTSGKGAPNADDVNVSFATVASSRTFNQSTGGTLGQYIPAIPFANFVGKVTGDARTGILSMQQIAQSPAFRTNLGILEASGNPASVLVSVFDPSGKNLLDLPIDLKAGEQQQLNSFLGTNNISLTDGRIEVKVTAGTGKVMAYASVVDNTTTDPLLVTGVPLAQTAAQSFVIPGVADLSGGLANWRTDLRIFNSGTDPQYVTMTLYPQTGSSSTDPVSRSVSINPGEISILNNIVASNFGLTNIGGALHVDTLTDANLVVTGRTYNQVDGGGTYGQFIAAVTPADAAGKGDRTLNVLQVEDSTRYRTNLGIAEVSGKPAMVEVSVFLPDAKVAPKVQIPLAANEYRQFRVLQQLGVGTAYNARITIRVIDGDGRIAAYGSVIDMQTQDPTYVPAQ